MLNEGIALATRSKEQFMKLITLEDLNDKFKFSQRFMVFIAFILYFVVGVSFYSGHIGMTAVDSFYYTCITITTVGYGDITPSYTENQRVFSIFFVIFGVGIVGTIMSTIGGSLMERQEELVNKFIVEIRIRYNQFKEIAYPKSIDTMAM